MSVIKLTPYKKLLTMGKEAVEATLAPVRAGSKEASRAGDRQVGGAPGDVAERVE